MAEANETTTPQDQGDDHEGSESGTQDFASRLQNQSAILGKVVNQSNNFAKDLQNLKETIEGLTQKLNPTREDDSEKSEAKKKRVSPSKDDENQLSFKTMQARLEALEAKDKLKTEVTKKAELARSLERHGVDSAISDKVAKMLMIDLADKISVDDSGEAIKVGVNLDDETLSTDSFSQMWLESDEGKPFKIHSKKSPTPKMLGAEPNKQESAGALGMIDFSKKVALAIASGDKESIKKLRLKEE